MRITWTKLKNYIHKNFKKKTKEFNERQNWQSFHTERQNPT